MTTSSESTASRDATAGKLNDRYGRTRSVRLRNRVIGWIGGVVAAAAVVAWVLWAGFDGTASSLETVDTGYALTKTTATARFELTVDPGTEVRCAVQALNESFEIVGWKIIDIPAADERTRAFSETVRTTMQPNTGLIYRCWLP